MAKKKTTLLGMTMPTLIVAAVAIFLFYSWKKPSTQPKLHI